MLYVRCHSSLPFLVSSRVQPSVLCLCRELGGVKMQRAAVWCSLGQSARISPAAPSAHPLVAVSPTERVPALLQGESVASWVARETPEGVEEQLAAARRSLGARSGGGLSPAGLAARQALEERHGSNVVGAGGHRLGSMGQPLELRGGSSSGQRTGQGQSLDDQARSSSLSSGRVRGLLPCCAGSD